MCTPGLCYDPVHFQGGYVQLTLSLWAAARLTDRERNRSLTEKMLWSTSLYLNDMDGTGVGLYFKTWDHINVYWYTDTFLCKAFTAGTLYDAIDKRWVPAGNIISFSIMKLCILFVYPFPTDLVQPCQYKFGSHTGNESTTCDIKHAMNAPKNSSDMIIIGLNVHMHAMGNVGQSFQHHGDTTRRKPHRRCIWPVVYGSTK